MKRIEITITPQGETHIETKGFTGPTCRDASRFLEQALGRQMAEQFTGEFFAHSQADEKAQQQS